MSNESNWKTSGYIPSEHGWNKATLNNVSNFGYPENYFYADSIKNAIIAFGSFFNDINVIRYDENGYPRKIIQVPIKFGPRAKSHDFRVEKESGKTYYIQQPNMFYKITSVAFDAERAESIETARTFYEDYLVSNGIAENAVQQLWQDIHPTPYNITIESTASCDKMEDALQILEQICSKFNPANFLYVKEFWFMNIRRDIKMKMENSSLEYNEDYGEEDKREITVKFTFTLECNMYHKIDSGTIIDQIVTKLIPNINDSEFSIFGISGNYDGSLTSRYNFSTLGNNATSGNKNFITSEGNVIDTTYYTSHSAIGE